MEVEQICSVLYVVSALLLEIKENVDFLQNLSCSAMHVLEHFEQTRLLNPHVIFHFWVSEEGNNPPALGELICILLCEVQDIMM